MDNHMEIKNVKIGIPSKELDTVIEGYLKTEGTLKKGETFSSEEFEIQDGYTVMTGTLEQNVVQ